MLVEDGDGEGWGQVGGRAWCKVCGVWVMGVWVMGNGCVVCVVCGVLGFVFLAGCYPVVRGWACIEALWGVFGCDVVTDW